MKSAECKGFYWFAFLLKEWVICLHPTPVLFEKETGKVGTDLGEKRGKIENSVGSEMEKTNKLYEMLFRNRNVRKMGEMTVSKQENSMKKYTRWETLFLSLITHFRNISHVTHAIFLSSPFFLFSISKPSSLYVDLRFLACKMFVTKD